MRGNDDAQYNDPGKCSHGDAGSPEAVSVAQMGGVSKRRRPEAALFCSLAASRRG